MDGNRIDKSFVTPKRITLATNYACELAEREPWASAADCAGKAVRQVFGRWLLDPTAAIRTAYLPLYCKLVSRVESDMGLHRASRDWAAPSRPQPGPTGMAAQVAA